jgi:hypothetical protein
LVFDEGRSAEGRGVPYRLMRQKLKVFILLGSVPLFVLLFENATRNAVGQTAVLTAGQKFKNVKVLKDMPADDMGKVMNIMSESLGVNCDFCHYGYEFEKEGKKEFETSRKMIRMTWDINKDYFEGKPEVSCNTCHDGRPHPLSAPNLNPGQVVERRPKQPDTKPSVAEILRKYERAINPRSAVRDPKSDGVGSRRVSMGLFIRAVRIEPDGTTEKEEIWQKPGKLVISTFYPPSYTVTEGFDGTAAWKTSNADAIALKPDEVEQIRRTAELFAAGDLKAVYPRLEFGTLEKINGRDVYVLRATSESGTRERLFFDVQNGLLVRRTASLATILGAFVYQVDYNDYKSFGGAKLPFTTRVAMPGISFTRKILQVKIGPAIKNGKFVSPAIKR